MVCFLQYLRTFFFVPSTSVLCLLLEIELARVCVWSTNINRILFTHFSACFISSFFISTDLYTSQSRTPRGSCDGAFTITCDVCRCELGAKMLRDIKCNAS